MFTLVHAADIHLETTFPDVRGGNRRRAALADAFVRIVDLARDRGADALTLGGDIYEAQRAGPQTARFLFEHLARFGKPVYIAPGNHDPYAARSLYARDDLPPNVRVFAEPTWSALPLTGDITLYGFGHTPAEPGRPFAHARFDRPGVRLALVHGSDEARCPPKKRATAPFTLDEIVTAGATLALAGHYHGGYVAAERDARLAYPGSPEPIKFGEGDAHGALVVRIEGKHVDIEPVMLARTQLIDLDLRVDGVASEHALIAALDEALTAYGSDDFVRLRLHGTIENGTRVDRETLAERCGATLGALEIANRTVAADYVALAREPNVRGHAIGDLLQAARGGDSDAESALGYVVAAFEGAEIAP
jgi:DNA repair protein SbcD/Mre11